MAHPPHISTHVQPWAGHARLHPAITAMAQNPEDALIVLPAWTSHEGFGMLAHLPPHLPVWVVDDHRDLEQALAVAGLLQLNPKDPYTIKPLVQG